MNWIPRVLLVCAGVVLLLVSLVRASIPMGAPNENVTYLAFTAGVVCLVLFVVSFFVKAG